MDDLGCLFGQSGKFKTIFKQIAISENGSFTTIKPLCATRWTVRTPAIKSVLTQYEVVLAALEEMASDKRSVSAPRARGLLVHFHKGTTVLGLVMGQDILLKLEGLDKSLQGRAVSIGGMLQAVDCTKKAFMAKSTNYTFMSLYSRAVELASSFDLEPIMLPHIRKPSNRYGGPANSHIPFLQRSTSKYSFSVPLIQLYLSWMTDLARRALATWPSWRNTFGQVSRVRQWSCTRSWTPSC